MDTTFQQWVALTDAYAHRLSEAMRGDTAAFEELKYLAGDVQRHHPHIEVDGTSASADVFAALRGGGAERH